MNCCTDTGECADGPGCAAHRTCNHDCRQACELPEPTPAFGHRYAPTLYSIVLVASVFAALTAIFWSLK